MTCDDSSVSDRDQVRWAQQFAEKGFVAFPTSRAKMSLVLLGCLAFSALGVWMILQREVVPAVFGWLSLAFFGIVGIPILSWRWITRRPIVHIDQQGVASGQQRAAWADIEGFRVWSMHGQAAVVVQLTPRGAKDIATQVHPIRRWWDGLSQSMVGPATMFFPSGNGFDPDAMATWLNSLRQSLTAQDARGSREPNLARPAETGVPLVPDWPTAVPRPTHPPNPDLGFESEGAPRSAVGVLQWTSGLLVDGGSGSGCWDFINLDGWASGDMSGVIAGFGDRSSDAGNLARAVGNELGHQVSFTPSTWVFSREEGRSRWTAPLFVVHRSK